MTPRPAPIRHRMTPARRGDRVPAHHARGIGVVVAAVLFALAAGAEILTTLTFEPAVSEPPATIGR